jgi:hypothetical protein
VMGQCRIICNPKASKRFAAASKKGERELYIRDVLSKIVERSTRRK